MFKEAGNANMVLYAVPFLLGKILTQENNDVSKYDSFKKNSITDEFLFYGTLRYHHKIHFVFHCKKHIIILICNGMLCYNVFKKSFLNWRETI